MKFVPKSSQKLKNNSDICVATEFGLNDDTIDFAIVTINGRYPAQNRASNLTFKELVYIHKGAGKVVVNGIEQLLSEGDLILIEAGDKYFWEGSFTLHITCRPSFKKEQHCYVE